MDNRELKIQALSERIGELTVTYENKIADLRVELTDVYNQLRELQQEKMDAGHVEKNEEEVHTITNVE